MLKIKATPHSYYDVHFLFCNGFVYNTIAFAKAHM